MSELDTSAYTPAHKTENEEQEEQDEEEEIPVPEDINPYQVTEFLDKIKYVKKHTKVTELENIIEQVIEEIEDNGNVKENMVLKRYQCLKCTDVFTTKKAFKGHYHSSPNCGGMPRWRSEYEDAEDQMNIVKR